MSGQAGKDPCFAQDLHQFCKKSGKGTNYFSIICYSALVLSKICKFETTFPVIVLSPQLDNRKNSWRQHEKVKSIYYLCMRCANVA